MDAIEKEVQRLMDAANPPAHDLRFYPDDRPKLKDLWPCEQEKWKRLAEASLGLKP